MPRTPFLAAALFALAGAAVAQEPTQLALEDQFDRKVDLGAYRGSVVVLVYGDRRGTDACKALGERLHVCWHPDAKGQPPARAQAAPVVGLDGLPPGKAAPDVRVIPVACCGKVPGPIRGVIRTQIAKGAPDVPVWLDFADAMKANFGLTPGEPNLVVIDAADRDPAAKARLEAGPVPRAEAVARLQTHLSARNTPTA
jgi:hypothetical protein